VAGEIRSILMCAAFAAATITAPAASAQWWQFEGKKFDCVGRNAGNNAAKVYCSVEYTHGNRIYRSMLTFDIRGPVARLYIGRKKDCWLVEAKETRFEEGVVACPGIPVWWKR